jgi:effector-binding domain-containing protein
MKTSLFKFILFIFVTMILFSCSNSGESQLNEKKSGDSIQESKVDTFDLSTISNEPGVVGVIDVGEMLTICKVDSAPMKDVSFKVAKAYSVLEEEMNAIGAKLDGSPGMITYNNDTSNFIFECVLPIKDIPKKEPKVCKIVVLEASQMLIYNFYGPYQHLFSAYDKIRKYIATNRLQQSGPMREFYLTDATIETDPAKWQTRILVPVIKLK